MGQEGLEGLKELLELLEPQEPAVLLTMLQTTPVMLLPQEDELPLLLSHGSLGTSPDC